MLACRPAFHIVRTGRTFSQSAWSLRRLSSTLSASNPDVYDIVCVGGGPAGLSLVNGLKANPTTSSLRIALIDSLSFSSTTTAHKQLTPSTYSNRCSSLTPSSIGFLKSIGTWEHVDRTRTQPYNAMRVWDGVSNARINFDWANAADIGLSADISESEGMTAGAIATMTENSNIVSALLARASELGGISFFDSTSVDSITLGEDTPGWDMRSWPLVTLSSGQTLAARLLIGADGANSPVRTFAGIDSHGWDYERHGVVATLSLQDSDIASSTAYQRFLPSGPIALLPLPNSKASLVWTTHPSRASYLKSLPHADLASMINAAFRLSTVDIDYMHTLNPSPTDPHAYTPTDELSWRSQHTPFDASVVPPLVESVQPGSVASFPLRMRHASRYTGERVALVGDAAHTIHPLAGQGLNLGLADVQALLGVVDRTVSVGGDIGDLLALEAYDAERYARNHVVLGVCDKLHKLYSWESGPVVWGRTVGLRVVDGVGEALGVKGWIMKRAAGF